ncbi:D-glycero-alpha-D-manno-heptose-1,7-bisphosphate 7-phosphatase [soil metagenome]
MQLPHIDRTWTLFLDRDGVINYEKHEDYINTLEEFKIYPGVFEALNIFSKKFGRIFIITNQRGIAKGVTKPEDLQQIHESLLYQVMQAEGKIDGIYFCPDLESTSINRKPNAGMAHQVKNDFPDVVFSKTIMVGNTLSDMQFGRNAGVHANIFLPTTRPEVKTDDPLIDYVFPDLLAVAKAIN